MKLGLSSKDCKGRIKDDKVMFRLKTEYITFLMVTGVYNAIDLLSFNPSSSVGI
jgi:hypothetical protein